MKSVFQRDIGCLHCKINPKGIKPFIENLYHSKNYSQKTKDKIANMAKDLNRPEECIFCSILLFYWTKKTTY